MNTLDSALYSAFGQSEVSVIYTQLNQYYVVLEVAPQYWQTPAGFDSTYLTSADQSHIPLFGVSTVQANTIPLAINHTGLFPSVTTSFNLAPGISLSQATASIDALQEATRSSPLDPRFLCRHRPRLPAITRDGAYIDRNGPACRLHRARDSLRKPRASDYHHFNDLSRPARVRCLHCQLPEEILNVISIIGIVLLIGIVKKNAIMMIDFALQAEREEGKGSADAIFEACMLRFRPIMMTTMAALFGALPLAFGTGTGSELRRPLGISIVGGLIVSQMLTLYTTPGALSDVRPDPAADEGTKADVFHHGEEPLPSNA